MSAQALHQLFLALQLGVQLGLAGLAEGQGGAQAVELTLRLSP